MNADKPRNTREHIILELKRAGSLTTKELARLLGITNTAVRQVLNALQAEGLIDAHTERQAQGRPSFVYSLTQKGHELFPDAYDALAIELMETVREFGGDEMLRDIMTKQIEKKEERYRHVLEKSRPLLEKLVALSRLRDSDGYMAEVVEEREGNTLVLREYNCPILRIAKEHPQMCAHEEELMERVLGATLERTHHILAGEHYCCFKVSADEPITIERPPTPDRPTDTHGK